MKLIIFVLLLSTFDLFSQEIPENKYDASIKYNTHRDQLVDVYSKQGGKTKVHRLGLLYSNTTFHNSTFGQSLQSGSISNTLGANLNYKVQMAKQIIGDVDVLFQYLPSEDYKFYQVGIEPSIGLILIPFSYKLTKYIQPYATIGYQLSGIRLFSATNPAIYDAEKDKATNTSSPIWKAGLMVNLGNTFYINAQYKQSFLANEGRDFGSWGSGFGFRF